MGALLFRLARSRLAPFLLGFIFTHMSFAVPVRRLYETPTLLAFHYPKPSYSVHILIVPRRALPSLMALTAVDGDFLHDVVLAVQKLVNELGLEQPGYRLITNGGAYQDVPLLHFHLVSGKLL